MKQVNTDVVIIAGGPAGLAAAITAGERGLKSVILEKSSTTGGAANMGMGPSESAPRSRRISSTIFLSPRHWTCT